MKYGRISGKFHPEEPFPRTYVCQWRARPSIRHVTSNPSAGALVDNPGKQEILARRRRNADADPELHCVSWGGVAVCCTCEPMWRCASPRRLPWHHAPHNASDTESYPVAVRWLAVRPPPYPPKCPEVRAIIGRPSEKIHQLSSLLFILACMFHCF